MFTNRPGALIWIGIGLGAGGGTLLALGERWEGAIMAAVAFVYGWSWDRARREDEQV
jgi:hypothetical protein